MDAMARDERHRATLDRSHGDRRGRLPVRGVEVQLARIVEQRIEPRPAENPHPRLRRGAQADRSFGFELLVDEDEEDEEDEEEESFDPEEDESDEPAAAGSFVPEGSLVPGDFGVPVVDFDDRESVL
jgi:hypothetical protein